MQLTQGGGEPISRQHLAFEGGQTVRTDAQRHPEHPLGSRKSKERLALGHHRLHRDGVVEDPVRHRGAGRTQRLTEQLDRLRHDERGVHLRLDVFQRSRVLKLGGGVVVTRSGVPGAAGRRGQLDRSVEVPLPAVVDHPVDQELPVTGEEEFQLLGVVPGGAFDPDRRGVGRHPQVHDHLPVRIALVRGDRQRGGGEPGRADHLPDQRRHRPGEPVGLGAAHDDQVLTGPQRLHRTVQRVERPEHAEQAPRREVGLRGQAFDRPERRQLLRCGSAFKATLRHPAAGALQHQPRHLDGLAVGQRCACGVAQHTVDLQMRVEPGGNDAGLPRVVVDGLPLLEREGDDVEVPQLPGVPPGVLGQRERAGTRGEFVLGDGDLQGSGQRAELLRGQRELLNGQRHAVVVDEPGDQRLPRVRVTGEAGRAHVRRETDDR